MNETAVAEVRETRIKAPARSLRVNFSWMFVGHTLYAVCQACMLIVVAQLGDKGMVGRYALALVVTTPWIMLGNLHLRMIQATDQKHDYEFADYFGLRLLSCVLGALAICVVALVIYDGAVVRVIAMMGIAKAIEAVSDVIFGLLQRDERMERIAMSMMIKGPLSLMGLGLGMYLTGDVLWGVVGIAVSRAIVLIVFDFHSAATILHDLRRTTGFTEARRVRWSRSMVPRWDLKTMKRLVVLALPLGVAMMMLSLTTSIPSFFLERNFGVEELGLFAAMFSLTLAGTMVVNSLGQATLPRLAKYHAFHEEGEFWRLLLKLIMIGIGLGTSGLVLAVFAGPMIMKLLYGNDYSQYPAVINWLVASWMLCTTGSFLGYGMAATRAFRVQPFVHGSAVLGVAIFCYFAVPQYGMIGAAWAIGVSGLLQIVGNSVAFLYLQNLSQHEPMRTDNPT